MKIETEHRIGDKVYTILQDDIKNWYIVKMEILVDDNENVQTYYWLGTESDNSNNRVLSSRCFTTLDELVKSHEEHQ